MSSGPNPNAWNNWYHAVGSTYGTWIRGDPRGFRTHRKRFAVDGDYRNPPPPGVYAPIFTYTKRRMKHPPVKLSIAHRNALCRSLAAGLIDRNVEVIALAVAINHFHLLARFPSLDADEQRRLSKSILADGRDPAPRHWLGLARKRASLELAQAGMKAEGPVWAVRPKFDPVRDRPHQVSIARYIHRHTREAAAVYHVKHGFIDAG